MTLSGSCYNNGMIYTVLELSKKFRSLVGDGTVDIPNEFVINALNWAFNELPRVPKLEKLFAKHMTYQLDAKGHYRWDLNGDSFRRIMNTPVLNFATSTGGKPCPLKICNKDDVEFYNTNGIIELKEQGRPCQYTIEQEGDHIWLVLDRPSDVPIMIDYIAYGIPKPVTDINETISMDISAVAENLILDVMRVVWYHEADDFAFAADISAYLDNKKVTEAIQALNRRWGNEEPVILGEQ